MDLKKLEKELQKKMKPKIVVCPVNYCYLSTSRLSYTEQLNHSSLMKEITMVLSNETIDTKMAKKFFGASAEIVYDYKINKEFLRAHKNNPKMKYLMYDGNLLNDPDRILIPAYNWADNVFTLNPNFINKGDEQ